LAPFPGENFSLSPGGYKNPLKKTFLRSLCSQKEGKKRRFFCFFKSALYTLLKNGKKIFGFLKSFFSGGEKGGPPDK